MKRSILFAILIFTVKLNSQNQTQAYLDINNVKALILNRGDMFWDITGSTNSSYEVPKGSGKQCNFANAIWIGGYDANNQLHAGAMTYRQNGVDYWPGPLDTINCSSSMSLSNYYNKVWKVSTSDINNFITAVNNGSIAAQTYTPTWDIRFWPANGNTSLGFAQKLAPFVDVNADGYYDWHDGDYPLIKGDQMIYYIINDKLGLHTETGGLAMGVEMHVSAYAYNCPDVLSLYPELNYTTFYDYKVINRSQTQYNKAMVSIWSDVDLGYFLNDYIGCDTTRNMGYAYNGDNQDYTNSGFNHLLSYKILQGPYADPNDGVDNDHDGSTDEAGEQCKFSNFMYYNNNWGPFPNATTNPDTANNYYDLMRSIWKNGRHLQRDSTGYLCTTSTVANTNYAYTGDIQNNTGWTESYRNNLKGDRRFLIGNGPFTFKPGATIDLEFSIQTTLDSSANGNMNLAKVKLQNDHIQTFFNMANKPSCSMTISWIGENKFENMEFKLIPNPATDRVSLRSGKNMMGAQVKVYNSMGQLVIKDNINSTNYTLDISELLQGIYFVDIKTKEGCAVGKLIKN
jgi:hypothetical protein